MTALRPKLAAPGTRAAPDRIGGSRRGVWARAVAVLALAVPGVATAQFSVHPAMVEFTESGGVGTQSLTVENQGDAPIEVRVYLSDYDRTEDGGHSYLELGSHESSCEGRLQAFPDQLAVEPGRRGEIRLRLEGASSACWGIVFVEKRTPTASGITVAQRIGVKVLARPPGGTMEGRVRSVEVDTAAGLSAVIGFDNEGERVLDLEGEVEIRDLTGEILEVLMVEPFRVLPGRTRHVRVPLEDAALVPGRYVVVAILDFGGDYLVGGQTLLEVEP